MRQVPFFFFFCFCIKDVQFLLKDLPSFLDKKSLSGRTFSSAFWQDVSPSIGPSNFFSKGWHRFEGKKKILRIEILQGKQTCWWAAGALIVKSSFSQAIPYSKRIEINKKILSSGEGVVFHVYFCLFLLYKLYSCEAGMAFQYWKGDNVARERKSFEICGGFVCFCLGYVGYKNRTDVQK